MRTTRTLAAALAAIAFAAPAAQARTAGSDAPVASPKQTYQDLRSPDARDAAIHLRRSNLVVDAPGATAVDSASKPAAKVPAGEPTWPVDPKPIGQAPASHVTGGDDGTDWTTIGLGIAGSLLAVSLLGAYTNRRSRRLQRVRVAA